MSCLRNALFITLLPLLASAGTINFSVLAPRSNYAAVVDGDGSQSDLNLTYRTLNADFTPYSNQAEFWNGGYSDLPSVVYSDENGKILEITMTPVGFSSVTLNSFYLGSYSGGPARTASVFRITDGDGNILFSDEPHLYQASPIAQLISPGVQAPVLKLLIGFDWDLGVNALDYSTSDAPGAVPEPSAMLLMGAGLAVVALRKRFV